MSVSYAWRGHGSAIFIELGKLDFTKRKNHPKGEFSIMLDCEWRIENTKSIECGSFCEAEAIENALLSLVGDNVTHIETFGTQKELVVVLQSGKNILSFTSDIGNPEWCMFLPNNKVLVSKNGDVFSEDA